MHCGVSVRELYGPLAFHIRYLSHLCDNSLIPKPSPPPTVACKTTGGEHLVKRLRRIGGEHLGKRLHRIGGERLGKRRHKISNLCQCSWSNITWVCANLGFIVHPLCHLILWNDSYCCRQQGFKVFGSGLKS